MLFQFIGIPSSEFIACCNIIDKIDKMKYDEIVTLLYEHLINVSTSTIDPLLLKQQIYLLLEYIQIKDINILKNKLLQNNNINNYCTIDEILAGFVELETLFQLLIDNHSVSVTNGNKQHRISWVTFDASIVRGLGYYTGIVFEANDRAHQLRAICGGGRYDGLTAQLTQDNEKYSIPAVGFGFGDAVIEELLISKKLMPILPNAKKQTNDVIVYSAETIAENAPLKLLSRQVCEVLREEELKRSVDALSSSYSINYYIHDPTNYKSIKNMLKYANKCETRVLILCLDNEYQEHNSFIIRDMKKNIQCIHSYNELHTLPNIVYTILNTV